MSAQQTVRKDNVAAQNRRARFDYHIEQDFEAGIVLLGSEVKSLRAGKANIAESYVAVEGGELFLVNATIEPYARARDGGHEPKRKRKLLMKGREIARLADETRKGGMTALALDIHFNGRGLAKVKVALAKGKKNHDKREAQKERDWSRQKSRVLRDHG